MCDIFICYSKKDRIQVKEIYTKLDLFGYRSWLDDKDILPGQNWKDKIFEAINLSKIFLICLSKSWIDERSYTHAELKKALAVMEELPENRIFIIPVRLDNCDVPESLKHLHFVDLFKYSGFEKLLESLKSVEFKKNKVSWLREMFANSPAFSFDPWKPCSDDHELNQFLSHYLQGKTSVRSDELIKMKDYKRVIKLWESLLENSYFSLKHPYWENKDFYKAFIQNALFDLSFSYIAEGKFLIGEKQTDYFSKAVNLIEDSIYINPYSSQGPSDSTLDEDAALSKNIDYFDFVNNFITWLGAWGINNIASICKCSEESLLDILNSLHNRFKELKIILTQNSVPLRHINYEPEMGLDSKEYLKMIKEYKRIIETS